MSTLATESSIASNPFTYGRPILDPKRFFGRRQEVRQVFNCLSKAESVSVVGERRIGKTSLLKYISHPDIRKEHGFGPEKSTFVFVDFQELSSDATPADFWAGVLKDVGNQIEDARLQSEIAQAIAERHLGTQEIGELLDSVTRQGRNVILLLDELENTTQQPHFGRDFFDGLRNLAGLHGLTLVTTSNRDLVELGYTAEVVGSPFFNIFSVVRLSCFTREEAEELIRKSLATVKDGFDFETEEKELAFGLSGCHPYFLQMACCFLFEAHVRGWPLEKRLSFVEEQLVRQMAGHFEYYWRHSNDEEKRALQALAALQDKKGTAQAHFSLEELYERCNVPKVAVLNLVKRNLASEEEGRYALFSPPFGNWVRENHPTPSGTPPSVRKRSGRVATLVLPVAAILATLALVWLHPEILEYLDSLTTAIGQFWDSFQNKVVGVLVVVIIIVTLILGLAGKLDDAIDILKRFRDYLMR